MSIARKIITDDKALIPYRPALNGITGGIIPTLIFQQIMYWWEKHRGQPFFKFKEPCEHADYKQGDSWCEELGISRWEFDSSISKISQKINRKTPKNPSALVWFWTDASRLTWYELNETEVDKCLELLYVTRENHFTKSEKTTLRKESLPLYVTRENHFSINKDTETTTETTTEITSENNKKGDSEFFENSEHDRPARIEVAPTLFSLDSQEHAAPPVPPPPPAARKPKKAETFEHMLPDRFQTNEFLAVWSDWEAHRRMKRSPLTEMAVKRQVRLLTSYEPHRAIEILDKSIQNGWTGLFPLSEIRSQKEQTGYVEVAENFNPDTIDSRGFFS